MRPHVVITEFMTRITTHSDTYFRAARIKRVPLPKLRSQEGKHMVPPHTKLLSVRFSFFLPDRRLCSSQELGVELFFCKSSWQTGLFENVREKKDAYTLHTGSRAAGVTAIAPGVRANRGVFD